MKSWTIFLSLAVMLAAGSQPVEGLDLVCLIIDQLSLDELVEVNNLEDSNLARLQKQGAFGLMNVRTAGHLQSESTYLSAGAGKRCQGSKNSHLGYNLEQGVLNPGIEELTALNRETGYQGQPGLLGKYARQSGVVIGILGNSDTAGGQRRTVTALAMDERGRIPRGDVSSRLLRVSSPAPWGYLTDWGEMRSALQRYRAEVDLLIIETGDVSRIEEYADWLTPDQLQEEKRAALEGIDDFLGYLLQEFELAETYLAVVVPTPPGAALAAGKKLSWLILAGGEYGRGWLTSRSTRREGLVTITDLLPTFLKLSGADGVEAAGFPLEYIREQQVSYEHLQGLNNRISNISNLRPLFIRGFIILQLGAVLLSIVLLVAKKFKYREILKRVNEYLLLSLLLTPANFLAASSLEPAAGWSIFLVMIMLTGVEISILIRLVKTRLMQIVVITLALALVISLDLTAASGLQADSILGYCSIIGARYYGLGNEYMGFYIGGFIVSLSGMLEFLNRKQGQKGCYYRLYFPLLLLPVIYLTGAADRGANFGGMITALSVSGSSYLYLYRNIPNPGTGGKISPWLRVFPAGGLILTLLVYLDYRGLLGERSHIGRTFERLISGDWQEIINIIYRKISMNIKLLRWTIWTRVLLAFITALFFLFRYPVARLRIFFNNYPFLAAGFYGGITGSIITMLVNDSGVVAAATMLFYPIFGLLLLIME